MDRFDDAIGLASEWPVDVQQQDEIRLPGLMKWARAYFQAGELLHFSGHRDDLDFYCGPLMQNVGLATELTLKTMLRGMGKREKDVRRYSHNTYKAYFDARQCFDEVKFINLHFSNTAHLSVPDEVRKRLTSKGEDNIDHRWRVYFDHLRLLDGVYDKPYRSRYISAGSVLLPETEIVLVGTKLLLTAMEERLT